MNKKGFTLIEILAVIALLGAIMLLVVPNVTKNFKESKKRLFYDNVLSIYSSASRTYFSQDNASNKSFSNTGVKLDVDISDDITYRVKVDSYGAVLSIYVTDGSYTYKLDNANGISKKDIKLANVIEGKVDGYLTLYEQLFKDNPTISTRTNFSVAFTTNTAKTLYKATENSTEVYYFAGNDSASTPINNWVKFGGFYWRIIRTNHDSSIRLLYSGTSVDTTSGYIGTSAFNTSADSPKYVGYMYGDSDTTLDSLRTYKYDSAVKTYIDNWYENNLSAYTNYLSNDAVYCSDKSVTDDNPYSTDGVFTFKTYYRLGTSKIPTYDCENNKDAFSVNNSEAKLKYPIALMTADERLYAGEVDKTNPLIWYYVNSAGGSITGNKIWWTLSPAIKMVSVSGPFAIVGSGNPANLTTAPATNVNAVRPVISLKGCTLYSKGNGTASSPYEVQMDGGC